MAGVFLARSAARLSSSSSALSRSAYLLTSLSSSSPAPPPSNPSPRSPLTSPPPARHLADLRSPISHRALVRSSAAVADRFERRFATMGIPGGGDFGKYYCLPALTDPRIGKDFGCSQWVTGKDVEKILDWENTSPKQVEIPFKPARVLLQDFTGVPAVVDLACMRDAMKKLGSDPNKINPLVRDLNL
ncbi:hypothetical protein BHM03_00010072 [Ensete ventricosum]|nr:hypothetical protein BHM03_00010072 [Ensete ventricosum]